MDKRAIFLFFFLIVDYVSTSPRINHVTNKQQVFCGTRLEQALALVCRGNYNSPTKKSFNDLLAYGEYDELFPSGTDEDNQIDFPFLQKEAANSVRPMKFGKRSGIVQECCYKPCSYQHLSLYCA